MFLIWGWRTRSKTLSQGSFYCPSCGGDRHYDQQQARRWFTLFFLPVIPLKVLGEFIECQTCKNGYDMEVLSLPTSAALADQLLGATREAVVQLLRIDSSATAREAALRALSEVSGQPWSEEHLDADLIHIDTAMLPPRLHQMGEVMNEHGKERFLATATSVAAGAGVLSDGARTALAAMAHELGMTPAHARGVIDQAVDTAGR